MSSFRSRLSRAFALITVCPLAASIVLLTGRIETMVRTQAGERLDAALAAIRTGIAGDAERVSNKLDILARDPELKRLYLLRGAGRSRELLDHLAERRFLLDLDFLQVADTNGAVVAEAPPDFSTPGGGTSGAENPSEAPGGRGERSDRPATRRNDGARDGGERADPLPKRGRRNR